MFEAYITNTAPIPLMGIEVGDNGTFPHDDRSCRPPLPKIGIDRERYSEVFFYQLDSDVLALRLSLRMREHRRSLVSWATPCWKYRIRADWKPLKPLLSWETHKEREG